jgi:uncharacterized protein YdeI (YjbR/CyaY-like superfamily)
MLEYEIENTMKPTFFASPGELRKWFEDHHDKETELLIGYYKKSSGKPSITWTESVNEALCYGWIDAVRQGIDETVYTIRFTPRKPGSIWSATNIKNAETLIEKGLMRPAGLKAFEARKKEKSVVYSYEQKNATKLPESYEKKLKANHKAWEFFHSTSPSYQQAAIWWIMSARQEETKLRRLEQLIQDSEQGRTVPPLTPRKRKG